MNLSAVVVSVDFADVLGHTLALNARQFDRLIVVTAPHDKATWRVCRHHHVECVATDEFYRDDQAFNKGRGINVGLAALGATDWVLHMDADIVLPPRFRDILQRVVRPDPASIYGIDRMMCPSFEAWTRHIGDPVCQHADEIFVVPRPWPLGERVAKLDGEGYVPIGFFQLWNVASGIVDYPTAHGTAGRTDMLHALRWPRARRVLIPEIVGIHLEGALPAGERNWRGRRMDRFGPPPLGRDVPSSCYSEG